MDWKGGWSRRRWLSGCATVGAISLGGCLRLADEGGAVTENTDPTGGTANGSKATATSEGVSGPHDWVTNAQAPFGRPVVSNGTVFAGSVDEHLYAIDATTGETVWTAEADDRVRAPVVKDGSVYFESGSDLFKIDTASGETTNEWYFEDVHHVGSDRIFVGTGEGITAFDRTDKTRLWQSDIKTGYGGNFGPMVGAGLFVFGAVRDYVDSPDAERDKDTRVFALDIETGEKAWHLSHERFVGASLGLAFAVHDDTIAVALNDGTIFGVSATDGTVRWETRIERRGSGSSAPQPVTVDGQFLLASDEVIALDPNTGDQLWTAGSDLPHVNQSPSVVGDVAYYPAGGFWEYDRVVGIDSSGSVVADRRLPETFETMPTVDAGHRFYLSYPDATIRGYRDPLGGKDV